MPSPHTSPLFTPTAVVVENPIDAKARTEYERDRQKALKAHDIRKKYSSTPKDKTTTTAAGGAARRLGLGHGSWRNSLITPDDMEDVVARENCDPEDDDRLVGKENSKPSPRVQSVSLEDLLRASPPRRSVSRISLSRQTSVENLTVAFPNVSLTPPPLPLFPISESAFDLSFEPMHSTSSNNDEDDDLLSATYELEFSSPGAGDWTMNDTEDGCARFVNIRSSSSVIVVEQSAW